MDGQAGPRDKSGDNRRQKAHVKARTELERRMLEQTARLLG